MEYAAFVSQALEQFKTLPEETDELYKRYFVAMPLEAMGKAIMEQKPAQMSTQNQIKEVIESLERKFEAIIWSNGEMVESKNIRVIRSRELGSNLIEGLMTKSSEDKIAAFLQAHSSRTIMIDVPKGETARLNVLLVNTTSPLPVQILVSVEEGATLNLFEYYTSSTSEQSLLGSLHEIRSGKHSSAEINVVHNEDKNTLSLGWLKAEGEERCNLKINFVYNGGTFTRSRNKVDVAGFEANTEVNELILSAGDQKMDISTNITNTAKNSNAVLESKAVLMDRSICLLKGYASIMKNAAGSRSYVNERGIVLDKTAHLDSIPSMSIGNSDVKATHSSATAPMDEESIFYLMSRGASEIEAKKMVINGFISGIIGKIDDVIVREIVASIINEKVTTKGFGTVPKVTTESLWLAGTAQKSSSIFKGHYKYRGE
ncbi:MAG: SufD family Fe-S cluster assembly protein [Candidatus Micrarchaeota archaeon]|nr:SufD family Fe-S cluster assembly protein [Candidatus Micrarchaeota archaeon]